MDSDELYISFLFPPSDNVSGLTVFKRIAQNECRVDVLQSNFKSDKFLEFNSYVDEYVSKRIVVDIGCKNDWSDCIFEFVKKGMKAIEGDYGKIYSRSWLMANHFLAFEYKCAHPDAFWIGEFSDPLIYDLSNNPKTYKEMLIDDENYISKVNRQITDFNKSHDTDYPLLENGVSAYFVAEYLVYLFADEIIFTNENQRSIMLGQFPADVEDLVLSKSEIKRHPTLDERFYQIKDVDLRLDEGCINIAYFGNDYYSKRHFEGLFYAVEALNHKYKDKLQIHIYSNSGKLLKKLISSDAFSIKRPIGYLDFLNATTKYDVLIVNDVVTKGNFDVNPYLPSKLSDYLGSGRDVWALYEKGSSLSKMDVKYKSDISDYDDCLQELVRILDDYGFGDENCGVDEDYINKRLTDLNELYEKEFNAKRRLEREVKKLRKENEEIKSSNSWKITKPLRRIKNK